jgi:hypothetical protein
MGVTRMKIAVAAMRSTSGLPVWSAGRHHVNMAAASLFLCFQVARF